MVIAIAKRSDDVHRTIAAWQLVDVIEQHESRHNRRDVLRVFCLFKL
jgi:hypothetical protein